MRFIIWFYFCKWYLAIYWKAQALDDWVEQHLPVKLGLGLVSLIGINALLYWLFTAEHHARDFIPIPIGSGIVFIAWVVLMIWLHKRAEEEGYRQVDEKSARLERDFIEQGFMHHDQLPWNGQNPDY